MADDPLDYVPKSPADLPSQADFDASHAAAASSVRDHFNGTPPPPPPGAQPMAAGAQPPPPPAGAEPIKQGGSWIDKLQHGVGEWWKQVNPVEGAKGVAEAVAHPVDAIRAYGAANGELAQKAEDAFKKGDYAMGFHHGLAYLLNGLPGVGTTYDKASTQANAGDVAGALGTTAGLATNLLAPEALKKLPAAAAVRGELTPEAASAVKFADDNNIPISAGTRTGNKFVKNVQSIAQNQPIASTVANHAIADTRAALTDTAASLGDEATRTPGKPLVSGAPVPTAESAGAGVSQALSDLSQKQGAGASKSYSQLEKIEALPQHLQTVQVGTKSTPTGVVDSAGNPIMRHDPITKDIALPVDMRAAKASLKPVLDRLEQEMPLAQQQSSRGLLALRNVVSGEDILPASVADQNLSSLKQLQREAVHPKTKYLATQAVNAVGPAVDAAVAKAGQPAVDALNEGRALTKAKFATDATLDQLPTEPVRLFDKLTSGRDTSINLLRDVQAKAPDAMPAVGRAYLEGLFEKATAAEGKPGAGTAFSQWNKLGDATKKNLFPDAALRKNLDDFFQLAKMTGENPNPSGSAHVGSSLITLSEGGLMLHNPVAGVASILAWPAVTKMLYSTRGAKLLQTGLRVSPVSAAAPAIARVIARAGIVSHGATEAAGAPALPQAADDGKPQEVAATQ